MLPRSEFVLLFEIIFTPEATKEMKYRKEVKIPQTFYGTRKTTNTPEMEQFETV